MGTAPRGSSIPAYLAMAFSAVLMGFASVSVYAAGLTVGAGGTTSLANGSMDLGCGDLVINGTLNLDSGTMKNVDNVVINSGGTFNGGTGLLTLSGNWTNNGGTTNPGSSQVTINTDCGSDAVTVSGDSTFWNFTMQTGSGRQLNFAAGSNNTFNGHLVLNGAGDENNPANLLKIRSTSAGSAAFIFVNGTYAISKVDVSDNHAEFPGEWVDWGYPEDFDSIDGPGNYRWFRSGNDNGDVTFHVTKVFDDGNPASVTARISCDYGLPLVQEQALSSSQDVTFVVTSIDATEAGPDCRVWEEDYPGYTGSYEIPECNPFTESCTAVNSGDKQGCFFVNVHPREGREENTCAITNTLQPVQFTIDKEWVNVGMPNNGDGSMEAEISLHCSSTAPQSNNQWSWDIQGNAQVTADVLPRWQGDTVCTVSEEVKESEVETSGCEESYPIAPGDEELGCTLTNTVFYEGIPTLNDLGLAIMALLMLGVGLIGYRRVM